ncbi:UNVERIFIED_CONTAM: hypothetical protein Slati_3694100 [Sesamum latifolium]|uniref:Uncharacterized protein n=1 Tax=Sesamum latifolium TaxID=2727402 RepID=A0AAW2U2H1_9LAMI
MTGTSLAHTSGTPAPAPLRPIDPVAEPHVAALLRYFLWGIIPATPRDNPTNDYNSHPGTNGNIGFGLNSYASDGCPEKKARGVSNSSTSCNRSSRTPLTSRAGGPTSMASPLRVSAKIPPRCPILDCRAPRRNNRDSLS